MVTRWGRRQHMWRGTTVERCDPRPLCAALWPWARSEEALHSFPFKINVGQSWGIVGYRSAVIWDFIVQCSLLLAGTHLKGHLILLVTPHTSKARGRVTVMEGMNFQVQEFVSFWDFDFLFFSFYKKENTSFRMQWTLIVKNRKLFGCWDLRDSSLKTWANFDPFIWHQFEIFQLLDGDCKYSRMIQRHRRLMAESQTDSTARQCLGINDYLPSVATF